MSEKTCPNCGEPFTDGMRFCRKCGSPLISHTGSTPAPSPAPASRKGFIVWMIISFVFLTISIVLGVCLFQTCVANHATDDYDDTIWEVVEAPEEAVEEVWEAEEIPLAELEDWPVEETYHEPVEIVTVDEQIPYYAETEEADLAVVEEPASEPELIYTTANVQQPPVFRGGEQAMYKWLVEHINYPSDAAEQGVDGRVVVQFEVSKTGKIENVCVVRGRHPALDREAVRVVSSMPAWIPGKNNGVPVRVTFNLPVTFKLPRQE